jgi:hypothetical protein
MRTRAEAEAKLAELGLTSVLVSDATNALGQPCRSFEVGGAIVNLSRDPDDAELETLARHLPVPANERATTLAKLKSAQKAR